MAIVEAAAGNAARRLSSLATDRLHAFEEELFGKLLSIPKHYVSILLNLDHEIGKLAEGILPKLKELIINAEVNSDTKVLYVAFRRFYEDAEDILDEYNTELSRCRERAVADPQPIRFRTLLNLVCSCLPCSSCFDFFDYESVPLHFYEKIAERIISFYDDLEKMRNPRLDRIHSFLTSAKDVICGMSDRTTKKQFERDIIGGLLGRDNRVVGIEEVEKKVIHEEIKFLRKSLPELKKVIMNADVNREEMDDLYGPFEIIMTVENILGDFDREIGVRHAADQQPNRFKTVLKLACGCVPFSCFDSSDYGKLSHTFYVMIANRMKEFYDELEELRSKVYVSYQFLAALKDAFSHIGDQTTEKQVDREITDETVSTEEQVDGEITDETDSTEEQVDREITGEKMRRHFRLAVREGVKKKVTYEETVFLRKKFLPKFKKLLVLTREEGMSEWDEEDEERDVMKKAIDIIYDLDRLAALGHEDHLPWSSIFGSLFLNLRTANQIRGLYGELERVKRNEDKLRLFIAGAMEAVSTVKEQTPEADESPSDGLRMKDFHVVGRKKTKDSILAELLSEPLSKPSVILITGMGGIGKTTLVQEIFHTPLIVQHFDQFQKWVCVGDEFDLTTVMGKILDKDKGDRKKILEQLKDKRYLIVLDDCWSRKSESELKGWAAFWDPLSYGSDGSKVIITSREDISNKLVHTSVSSYPLGVLSDEECNQIFESYAFGQGVPSTSSGCDSTSRLQKIGKEIVKKNVRGVPLTARILGSSLRRTTQVDEWENVLQGVPNEDIMEVLMWSYRQLPTDVKQCFSYLSAFPKDHKLEKEEVVWMWIAQGYIQKRENLTLESIGKRHFDDLVSYSLVQKMQNDYGIYYNMHDLVHDLAIIVSGGGNFSDNGVANEKYLPSRHLIIEYSISSSADNNKKLQTLLNYRSSKSEMKYVRVLSSSYYRVPIEINFNKLICLRYLDLSIVQSRFLPESICSIYNLQTLLLHWGVKNFPLGRWKLPNLRHLIGGKHIGMRGIGNSTSLQTIPNFNLSNGGVEIEELGNLKELRGKLEIDHLDHVRSPHYASRAKLNNKKYIEELVLAWDNYTPTTDEEQNAILENLCPHENLSILEIENYMGDQCPEWMGDKCVLNLVELRLSSLHHIKVLPPLGHLPLLKHLRVEDLRNVRSISNEFYGIEAKVFPSLKSLFLVGMVGLEEWRDCTDHREDQITTWFPSLEDLKIRSCKALRSMPRLSGYLRRLIIRSTGLEVLPEICTRSNESDCYLEVLEIKDCLSLHTDAWFQKYRMRSLAGLRFDNVGHCINLVINYSRKRLRNVNLTEVHLLRSIRLSNLDTLAEFRETDYQQLSIQLYVMDALEDISIVNSEDGKITAGPLYLQAWNIVGPQFSKLEESVKKFKLDEEYNTKNEVDLDIDRVFNKVDLEVKPRKLV